MTDEQNRLRQLRARIDEIDNSIQDLLVRRTEIVEHVREVKESEGLGVKIRPSREAEILYRLIARHTGTFPKRELARIWRELIVATLSSEGAFSMAVYESESEPGYWDLARDQYGSFTPATRHTAARRVIEAVQTAQATIGIVPVPSRDDQENWWRHLVGTREGIPRIIARLPFIGSGNTRNPHLQALVICPVDLEKTGRDHSFIAIELAEDIGFNVIGNALSEVGFTVIFHQLWHDPERPPGWTYLVEMVGFIQSGDRQMVRLVDALGPRITRIVHLGGYAVPLTAEDLAPSSGPSSGPSAATERAP